MTEDKLKTSPQFFINNRFTRRYYKLIEFAKLRSPDIEGYYENHHIIPQCFGGSNDKDNKVKLTGREHYIVHKWLIQMVDDKILKRKMALAFSLFRSKNSNHLERPIMNSRDYEMVRKVLSETSKGIKPSEACFNALSKKLKGSVISDDHKRRISEGLIKIVSCQLIGPDDVIYDVEDLKAFCIEHDLSVHYFFDLYALDSDVRITCGKRKGWGLYKGIIRAVPEKSLNRSEAITTMWANMSKSETNRNTKYFWRLRDPEGVDHETYSISAFAKKLNLLPGVIQNAKIGIPIERGSWAGWSKLEQTKFEKESKVWQ